MSMIIKNWYKILEYSYLIIANILSLACVYFSCAPYVEPLFIISIFNFIIWCWALQYLFIRDFPNWC